MQLNIKKQYLNINEFYWEESVSDKLFLISSALYTDDPEDVEPSFADDPENGEPRMVE